MSVMPSRLILRRHARAFAAIGLVACVLMATSACGGKSPTQLADDALAAGIAAHSAGNTAEAQKQYQECLKQVPTHKVCHYDLGLLAQTGGDVATAEKEYRLSLSSDPNYTPA